MELIEDALTNDIEPQLVAATPGSGTYLNEANFKQANFQDHFYGSNYPQLLAIKNKYDPSNVFYAPVTVGSENFTVDASGRLCSVQSSEIASPGGTRFFPILMVG